MSAEEWFDIYDEAGRHLGVATRDEVHRLGWWHRTFHCWVVRLAPEGPYILVQRRHAQKDTNPNRYDVTVAGHLRAGEQLQDGIRELAEEIGAAPDFKALQPVGEYKHAYADGQGLLDCEQWTVFLYVSPAPLTAYRPNEQELAGLYELPLLHLLALFRGERDEVALRGIELCGQGQRVLPPVWVETTAGRADFVPRPPGYYADVLARICQRVLGRADG